MSYEARIVALAAAGIAVLAAGVAVATWGWAVTTALGFAVVLAGALVGTRVWLARAQARAGAQRTLPALRLGPPRPAGVLPVLAPEPPLLETLQALSPAEFEEFARMLVEALGLYRDVRRVGGSGDGGIDLVMHDHAGNLCVVQCKRYRGAVAPSVVRDLYGVMERHRAREAYLITTGRVSSEAQAWIGDRALHVWSADTLVFQARRVLGEDLGNTIKRARG